MWKLFGSKKTQVKLSKKSLIIYATSIVIGLILLAAASYDLIAGEREYLAAREEYARLSELYPVMDAYLAEIQQSLADGTDFDGLPFGSDSAYSDREPSEGAHPDPLAGLLEVNPDFIGWISIDDIINYPVVRGDNNVRYLDSTFTGQRNPAGTVFMDHRNAQGFGSDVCILYGHNMKDRTMFAQLHKYREKEFMEEHPNIIIVTHTGEVLVYRVFAARLTFEQNRAYKLNFPDSAAAARVFPNAPDDASRFLLLSTCTNSSHNDERLLVYAALKS